MRNEKVLHCFTDNLFFPEIFFNAQGTKTTLCLGELKKQISNWSRTGPTCNCRSYRPSPSPTHQSCQSYTAASPSRPWGRDWARASSRWRWWSGPSDSGEPPGRGSWPPAARRTGRSGRCPSRCRSAGTPSSWWRRWAPAAGQCCLTTPLEVAGGGAKGEENKRKKERTLQ